MSTGMKQSFGKPIGLAARVRPGQVLYSVHVAEANIEVGKKALQRAKNKMPCKCRVVLKD